MDKNEAKKRIEKLKKTINHHRYLYHVLDREEISPEALDSLKKELFDLEQKFPEFITPDSPTQRVGGKPLEKFQKVRHPKPMISLNDAFSKEDMQDWIERISRLLNRSEAAKIDFYCEPKLDGLAMEFIYQGGILKTGATRGNGIIGEDVTQNLKTIEAVPLVLRKVEDVVEELEKEGLKKAAGKIKNSGLRQVVAKGEVIITKAVFEKVNKKRKEAGQPVFANPRNLAAGSIRQLDPKVTASRKMDVSAYDLVTDLGQDTHEQEHKILKALGFKTNNKYSRHCKDLKEVFKFHDMWYKNRDKLPYEIDGIVVRINSNELFNKLGVVGKAPRGAIAFKFALKQATTVVEDIKVHVGRTGAVTPVAVLRPVQVGGVTISRATLHNVDEISRLGLKIGDTVIVGRAGDVIPDIIKVLPEMRAGKEKDFKMPKDCPSCGRKLEKPGNEVLWRCINPECPAQKREYFYHFVYSFDIVGLGPKIIDRLIDEGLISDPADLFSLNEEEIQYLERFAEKSSQNLISAIQSRKKIDLPRFLYALGIRNVGEETAFDLAENFGSLDQIRKTSKEELMAVADIGPVVSKSIYNFFRDRRKLEFIEKLRRAGVKITENPKSVSQGSKFRGLTFVLTGTLVSLPREEAKEKIRKQGGRVSESVSKETSFVVAGENSGSKYDKAKSLEVKIIGEKEFLEMIK